MRVDACIIGDVRDVLPTLPNEAVNCVVTSPPYWPMRDYGNPRQIGLESSASEYVETMTSVFRELRRILRPNGVAWLNLGDCFSSGTICEQGSTSTARNIAYAGANLVRKHSGLPPKNLVGIPWRVAFALQDDGWILRSDVIWAKPSPMPESVTDRPTRAHEYLFMLTKSQRYYYDAAAIAEPGTFNRGHRRRAFTSTRAQAMGRKPSGNEKDGWITESGTRNRRSVWTVASQPYAGAHFAVFPPRLIEPCILSSCPPGGIVLDPFFGSGTTGKVAQALGRRWLGVELSEEYGALHDDRVGPQIGLAL